MGYRKIRITKLRDLYRFESNTVVECYSLDRPNEECQNDRDRYLVHGELEGHYPLICDDGGGFIVDQDFIERHKVFAVVPDKRPQISRAKRFKIFVRDKYCCLVCGKTSRDGKELEVDHWVPISKGGSNSDHNLKTLCIDCNRGKRAEIVPFPAHSTARYPYPLS